MIFDPSTLGCSLGDVSRAKGRLTSRLSVGDGINESQHDSYGCNGLTMDAKNGEKNLVGPPSFYVTTQICCCWATILDRQQTRSVRHCDVQGRHSDVLI